jgi:NADPH:quinone reductase-like Zn-dependent oxidoreductase
VLVKVHASTINIDDIHVAEGTFYGGIPIGPRPSPNRPVTPGTDLAGMVLAVGKKVRSLRPGQPVFGMQLPFRPHGAWAELCPVDERWLTTKPAQLSFSQAAACGVSGLVALSAIHALKLRPGLRLVIVGASGGIGGMAVQLAKRAGAEVTGVCGSESTQRALQLGCSKVLDYHNGPWDQAVKSANCVLDLVGGLDIEQQTRRVLPSDGLFVTVVGPIRFIGDHALSAAQILAILARIAGRLISSRIRGPRYILTGPSLTGGKFLPEVAAAAASGVLPTIDSNVPFELEPVRQALTRAANHQNHGRIVIEMNTATAA